MKYADGSSASAQAQDSVVDEVNDVGHFHQISGNREQRG